MRIIWIRVVRQLPVQQGTCRTQGSGGGSDGGQVAKTVDTNFRKSCFATILKLQSKDDSDGRIKHQVAYVNAGGSSCSPSGAPGMVTCQTTVIAEPLINLCLPTPVPGFNAPMTFTFYAENTREETR